MGDSLPSDDDVSLPSEVEDPQGLDPPVSDEVELPSGDEEIHDSGASLPSDPDNGEVFLADEEMPNIDGTLPPNVDGDWLHCRLPPNVDGDEIVELPSSACSSLPDAALDSVDDSELDSLCSDDTIVVPTGFEVIPTWINGTLRDDVVELFSPPRVVPACARLGLRAELSMDVLTGYNFLTDEAIRRADHELERRRPRVLLNSSPCTWFSILTELWNKKKLSPDEIAHRSAEAYRLFEFGIERCERQVLGGNGAIHEHPPRATSWKRESAERFVQLPGVSTVDFDMCALGMTSPVSKVSLKKRSRLATNLDNVLTAFAARQCACTEYHLCGDRLKTHKIIQGSEHGIRLSKHSQVYPPAMCELLAQLIFDHVRAAGS